MSSVFLDADDLVALTGRKRKARQIDALRSMGVPFRINAAGAPVVARAAIEGGVVPVKECTTWQPKVV